MSGEYYQTLGVSQTATKDEIASAYRKLARKYHPDLNQDNPKTAKEQFQKIQEAYDIVGNDEKRKVYDQFGVSPDQMGNGGGQGPFQWSYGGGGGPSRKTNFRFDNIEDIMSMFGAGSGFGGANPEDFVNAGRYASKGQDLEQSITIPFVLAVTGGKTDIVFRRGGGSEETVSVKIPAGIESGKKIRLPGLGTNGQNGGKSGNLFLTIHVEDHPYYTRQGSRLYVKLPITLKEAVFGTKIDVPTPKGSVSLTIPPNSTTGTKLRVKNHGINGGDLFAELSVMLPKNWTNEDKALLEKIGTEPEKVRTGLHWN
ncbi:MAG: DnaJ domain-containing protein [Planctomycetaceae bacterium]|jgi:DnaJ-class molecular chaperone|nr:DnaJ domain-containing protein [Planctomycetaceae bacterium]